VGLRRSAFGITVKPTDAPNEAVDRFASKFRSA